MKRGERKKIHFIRQWEVSFRKQSEGGKKMSNSPCCRWPPSTRCAEKKREKKMHEKKSRFNSKGLGINSISGRHRPSSTHPPARQKVAVYFPFFFFSFASSQLFLRDLSTTGKSIQTGLSFRNRSAKKSQRVLLNQSTAARKKKHKKKDRGFTARRRRFGIGP